MPNPPVFGNCILSNNFISFLHQITSLSFVCGFNSLLYPQAHAERSLDSHHFHNFWKYISAEMMIDKLELLSLCLGNLWLEQGHSHACICPCAWASAAFDDPLQLSLSLYLNLKMWKECKEQTLLQYQTDLHAEHLEREPSLVPQTSHLFCICEGLKN